MKTPDVNGDKYLGELIRYSVPSLYGKPVYYTDGTKIPYDITVSKYKELSAEDI